jgi:predicted nucleotidyltransferase
MKIYRLLSTDERERILGYVLEHPSERINMNKLARELKLSVGQIHKYVTILREYKIVMDDRLQEIPLTCALRLLWNLKRIKEAKVVGILRRGLPNIIGIGIYGSWASGTNSEGADLDLWVNTEKEPDDISIAKVRRELETRMQLPVDLTITTPDRLAHFRKKSDAFYFSLYHGIVLWGDRL